MKDRIKKQIQQLVDFETEIAKITKSQAERRQDSKTYTNTIWYSYPNKALVGVDFRRVILQDIDPKKNKVSIHVNLVMQWYETPTRIELLNYDLSSRFGGDDATANLWIPNYRIKGYITKLICYHTY